MKIGLVGESPHDTKSIENLLKRSYPDLEFVNLLHDIRGSQLDQLQPTKRILRIEYQDLKPDLVIFIRDLDGLASDRELLKKRISYFREFRSVVDKKAVYMLNIWEIEAYILCDIEAFNNYYKCSCTFTSNPHELKNPKEYLKVLHKQYSEVDNAHLFNRISHVTLLKNSAFYSLFISKFEKAVNS